MTTKCNSLEVNLLTVVEAYRLDRYDNSFRGFEGSVQDSCRSLSFG